MRLATTTHGVKTLGIDLQASQEYIPKTDFFKCVPTYIFRKMKYGT